MSEKHDQRLGGGWLEAVLRVLQANTGDLRELALIAGADPRTLYIGTSLAGVDLRGQDLRGMLLSGSNLEAAIMDSGTQFDPGTVPGTRGDNGVAWPSMAAAKSRVVKGLSDRLGIPLLQRQKGSQFESGDGSIRAVVASSRRYPRSYQSYWYGFYESQLLFLKGAPSSFLVLAGADTGRVWAVPVSALLPFLDGMKMTRRPNGQNYWHVITRLIGSGCVLVAGDDLDLTPFEI